MKQILLPLAILIFPTTQLFAQVNKPIDTVEVRQKLNLIFKKARVSELSDAEIHYWMRYITIARQMGDTLPPPPTHGFIDSLRKGNQ